APVLVAGGEDHRPGSLVQVEQLAVGGSDAELDVRPARRTASKIAQVSLALGVDHPGDHQPEVAVRGAWLEALEGFDRELDVLLPHDPAGDEEESLAPTPR